MAAKASKQGDGSCVAQIVEPVVPPEHAPGRTRATPLDAGRAAHRGDPWRQPPESLHPDALLLPRQTAIMCELFLRPKGKLCAPARSTKATEPHSNSRPTMPLVGSPAGRDGRRPGVRGLHRRTDARLRGHPSIWCRMAGHGVAHAL